jgi:hypothetical protein
MDQLGTQCAQRELATMSAYVRQISIWSASLAVYTVLPIRQDHRNSMNALMAIAGRVLQSAVVGAR